jgi:predicted GNAT family N-acyltransferase
MVEVKVNIADWNRPAQQQALKAIREQVFMQEQGVSSDLEWDGLDDEAVHFIAIVDKQAVACARLLADGHIGRMAVLKPWRHQGIGKAVMQAILDYSQIHHYPGLFLHAQSLAVGFYELFGFQVEGDEFMDAGIPHRSMRLQQ